MGAVLNILTTLEYRIESGGGSNHIFFNFFMGRLIRYPHRMVLIGDRYNVFCKIRRGDNQYDPQFIQYSKFKASLWNKYGLVINSKDKTELSSISAQNEVIPVLLSEICNFSFKVSNIHNFGIKLCGYFLLLLLIFYDCTIRLRKCTSVAKYNMLKHTKTRQNYRFLCLTQKSLLSPFICSVLGYCISQQEHILSIK